MKAKKYHIILFNNKIKKKLIFSSNLQKTVKQKYKQLLKKTSVIFPINVLNKKICVFELALVAQKSERTPDKLIKDSLGRWQKLSIKGSDYYFVEVEDYKIEESLYDHQTSSRIETPEFIETYVPKTGVCQLFSLNNKIVVQNDDEFSIFSLKNVSEAKRFMDCIAKYFRRNNIMNCLLVKDFSTIQRKQLYKILENKGFKRSFLYKHYTQ
tara:strand:+ start:324 stop:956 length:633 start_codon:yes stop_codon:yes gene_type:complete